MMTYLRFIFWSIAILMLIVVTSAVYLALKLEFEKHSKRKVKGDGTKPLAIQLFARKDGYLIKDKKLNKWLIGTLDTACDWYQTTFTADEVTDAVYFEFGVDGE